MYNQKSISLISLLGLSASLLLSSCSDTPSTDNNTPAVSSKADLVITDIYTRSDSPNAIYVKYMNQGGAVTGQDFLIKLSSSKGSFEGNQNHRFTVPAPGTETETGAYKIDLLSLAKNESAMITAEIDWEGRLEESDESNNRFSKLVYQNR